MAVLNITSRKASKLAVAAAMMSIGAFGVSAFSAPAFAQDKEQKKYSKEFIEQFGPVNTAISGENPDYAALRVQAEAASASVQTAADRFAYGNALSTLGRELSDNALRRRGIEMMIDSGQMPEENLAQYMYAAGQLAFNMEDYAAARAHIEKAVALGYEDPQAAQIIAATYAREGNAAGSLGVIAQQINNQVGAGQVPERDLIVRALSVAYNNDMYEDATNFSILLAKHYPDKATWGDAIAIQRNYGDFSETELLDLLRLQHAAGAMRERRDYTDYIDAANYRRLPAEVSVVADEGISAGLLDSNDTFVNEAVAEAKRRVPGLRADLGSLERDARASGASASLAVAAGEAFLNFGQNAKAAEMYELALTRPDVDRAVALNRLGIAQAKAGDYAAAQATLAKVEGNRAPIAKLWAAYAAQKASGTTTAAASAS